MTTVAEAIKRIKWNGKQHIAVAIWCEDDVLERAKERHIKITREQAREIIDRIDHKQDCSLGITWDTIDCYLDEHKVEKREGKFIEELMPNLQPWNDADQSERIAG